jgi:large subunit ribosomal protein L10
MNKAEKNQQIEYLVDKLNASAVLYVTDTATLDAERTSELRRACFKENIELMVVKNTMLQKAIERVEGKDYSGLSPVLKGPSALMISETGNAPAKMIKALRKKWDKPVVKGAWIEEAVFIGDDQLEALVNIKSREELLGEIVTLLQSPAKNVISALKSGGGTIAGLVKTLSEREA